MIWSLLVYEKHDDFTTSVGNGRHWYQDMREHQGPRANGTLCTNSKEMSDFKGVYVEVEAFLVTF